MQETTPVAYKELPLLPPRADVETKDVLKLCIKARVALEHLKLKIDNSPHKDALFAILPVLECWYNCKLDNIDVSLDKMFLYKDKFRSADPTTLMALRCEKALSFARKELVNLPINIKVAQALCCAASGAKIDVRQDSKGLKQNNALLPLSTCPANGQDIEKKLYNLDIFLNSETELEPLLLLAIAFYQFEAILPMPEGNAKTGRLLNQLYLVHQQFLAEPYLCLSRYLFNNQATYREKLLTVREEEDWASWLKFFLTGIEESAYWTTQKAEQIDAFLTDLEHKLQEDPELKRMTTPLLEKLLARNPYVRIKSLVDAELVRRKTSSKYLNFLSDKGILEKIHTQRGDIFVNRPYLELLMAN